MNILIITGEQSGDLHAGKIAAKVAADMPSYELWGTGGQNLKAAGVELIADINDMACMGLLDAIKKLVFLRNLQKKILKLATIKKPCLAILVDYSGFNLKLAAKLHAMEIPVLYFITPKIWAWGANRAKKLVRYIDHAAVIMPFEEQLLKDLSIPCSYVGNPSYDQLKASIKHKTNNKTNNKLTLGLIPGSRTKEVSRHLQLFIEAAKLVKDSQDVNIIISKSCNIADDIYKNIPSDISVMDDAISVMQASDIIIIASGTATLEAAILATPMVIAYKTDSISACLFKQFAKTNWAGLPNILLNNAVVPEALQAEASAKNLAKLVLLEIRDLDRQVNEFKKLHDLLATNNDYITNTTTLIKDFIKKAHSRGRSELLD